MIKVNQKNSVLTVLNCQIVAFSSINLIIVVVFFIKFNPNSTPPQI